MNKFVIILIISLLISNQLNAEINYSECNYYKKQASYYILQSNTTKTLQSKYLNISKKYQYQYLECINNVKNKKTYQGYRSNQLN